MKLDRNKTGNKTGFINDKKKRKKEEEEEEKSHKQ
jgi:hypothetical protein